MPIANTYFDHFARYGYTLIVKLDNCRTNFETSINTNNHYISNSMFTLQGSKRISMGLYIMNFASIGFFLPPATFDFGIPLIFGEFVTDLATYEEKGWLLGGLNICCKCFI